MIAGGTSRPYSLEISNRYTTNYEAIFKINSYENEKFMESRTPIFGVARMYCGIV